VDKFRPDSEEARSEMDRHTQKMADRVLYSESWIAGNVGLQLYRHIQETKGSENTGLAPLVEGELEDGTNSNSEDGDDLKDPDRMTSVLPNVEEMEIFLIGGTSFRNLLISLHLFLLPPVLAGLTRVLRSIPNDRIWFSTEDNLSLFNKAKSFIEDHTGEDWNWWPLRPRMRLLKENQTRLHWRCVRAPPTFV
jgi:hypothetical protein